MTGSDDFGPTYWVPLNSVSVSTNVITAPDGTLTADKFGENTLGVLSHKVIARSFTLSASTTYTFSVFVKSAERTNIMIHLRKSDYTTRFGGFFNLSTKTFTSETAAGGTLVSSSITQFPNDWYRISVTGDIGTNTAAVTTLYLCNTSNSISYAGDGTSGIYVWGAQLEQGAFPTSYIPTVASTVPRSADNASMTGTNFSSWYNSSEGTVYSNTGMNGVQTGRYDRLWAITNSNLNLEGISLFVAGPVGVSGAYVSSVTITNSATEQINGALVESALTTPRLKSAFSFKTNDCASAYNGILRFVDKSAILLSNPDRLLIGQPQRYQGTSCMTISRLTYYPRALKPNQLQYLTQ